MLFKDDGKSLVIASQYGVTQSLTQSFAFPSVLVFHFVFFGLLSSLLTSTVYDHGWKCCLQRFVD